MTDWTTISSLATGAGTLVLAVATFSSIRSANRAARIAERTLMTQTRPLLFPSRLQDEVQKVGWGDRHWTKLAGGRAYVDEIAGIVYLAVSVRNVGAGIAVIQGWFVHSDWNTRPDHPSIEDFRRQQRDLYVAQGDVAFWQCALRDEDDQARKAMIETVADRERFAVDILYSDHEGGQRAIARFGIHPPDGDGTEWLASTARHWNLDRADPR